jgi:hypothetical protein
MGQPCQLNLELSDLTPQQRWQIRNATKERERAKQRTAAGQSRRT